MIPIDSGPLLALLDRKDPAHRACVDVARALRIPLSTTWAVFTEAMYLLGERFRNRGGWHAQERLWKLTLAGHLTLVDLSAGEAERSYTLMRRYRDLPMDLADATLVAFAESNDISRVFTLDKDFRVYRLHGRKAFQILP